jgi:mycothiol synthase
LLDLLSVDGEVMTGEEWMSYKDKLLPDGLFLIDHIDTKRLVATAGAVHNPNPGRYYFPFGGELGYLMVHPQHRKQGLGQIISWMVVQRLLSAGYKSIRVGVQGFRLAAIKTYLKVGFVPFLYQEDLYLKWERICEQIDWPYVPDKWPNNLEESFGD